MVRYATETEKHSLRTRTLELEPDEVIKDYSQYDCFVAEAKQEIVAWIWAYMKHPNQVQLHKLIGENQFLSEIIDYIIKITDALEVNEVVSFIPHDETEHIELFDGLGFNTADWAYVIKKARGWWGKQGL